MCISFPENTFLQPWLGVMVHPLRHLRAQDCPGWKVEKCHVSIPEDRVPPVLVGRYRAHATALHAQDCPDWDLENVFLP